MQHLCIPALVSWFDGLWLIPIPD